MAGSDWFEENIKPALRQRFHFGSWEVGTFVHTGLKIEHDPETFHIKVTQRDYAMGLTRIYVGADRRAQP